MQQVAGVSRQSDVERNDSKRTSGRSVDHVSSFTDDRASAVLLTLVGVSVPR